MITMLVTTCFVEQRVGGPTIVVQENDGVSGVPFGF